MMEASPFVVSFDWLEQHLGQKNLRVVDASWYLPVQNRNAKAEFETARIAGAVHFDIDTIADLTSGLPHTLPSPTFFAAKVGEMGISETDTIIVYDGMGMFSAPRVWWMFRIFGAKNCYVLDGGFDQWKAEQRPVETGTAGKAAFVDFKPTLNALAVVNFNEMQRIVETGELQIADARGAGRFEGRDPEPRAGMRSGHMPGAANVPYSALSTNGRLKPLVELKQVLELAGVALDKPVVTTCGSGITAAVITLALQSLGHRYNMLYDGSWSEWGGRADTDVQTGPAT
ncbi:MAG: 3-mercaptopyruvate sulfurtransferase [Notoacmeibacter sp.]